MVSGFSKCSICGFRFAPSETGACPKCGSTQRSAEVFPTIGTTAHTTDTFIVPNPVAHLKSLRGKKDAQSLYQAIVLGGAFIEGLGLQCFKKLLESKGAKFEWEDGTPYLGMAQVIKLLRSVQLIDKDEYDKFIKAVSHRNYVVHKMYSQWAQNLGVLDTWADIVIQCVEIILQKSKVSRQIDDEVGVLNGVEREVKAAQKKET